LQHKSGKVIDVEFISYVYTVGDEKAIQCTIRDITYQKQLREYEKRQFQNEEKEKRSAELQESEERFRKLFESHTAIQLILDPEIGSIVDANQAAAKFYGWRVEELRQMKIEQLSILSPETVKKNLEKICSSEQNHFFFSHRRKEGSPRNVEVFSNIIETSGKKLLYAIIHDITERKKLEAINAIRRRLFKRAELHSVEALLRATLDEAEELTESSIGFCCLLMDETTVPSLEVWSTNSIKKSNLMKRYKGDQSLLNKSGIWADAQQEQKAVIHNDYKALMKLRGTPNEHTGFTRTLVVPVMKGKRVIAYMGVGNKYFPYDEDDIRWVTALADIANTVIDSKLAKVSEKKTLDALIQSQKMEIVGQLTGGIAHDFGNMLCVILGYTEMALKEVVPELPLHADLVAIHNAATRSADLSQKLLTFARNKSVTPKILPLNKMVEGMVSLLQRLIGKQITLTWIPDSEPAKVRIDPVHLDQILANLCVNGRDAIEKNGHITIETSHRSLNQADCTSGNNSKEPGEYVILTVTDNGSGIAKKDLPHIFEPFFTTKAAEKGTGLGLSIIQSIVNQNHGYIECESTRKQGTSFTVYLPRYEGVEESTESAPPPEPAASHSTATILLVEDEPDILLLCKEMFEDNGYTVLAAATPTEAIQLAEQHREKINLLLSDVVLPEMTGCDLYKKLLPTISDLKALFMSGYTPDVIASQGLFDEKIGFIQKPFRFKSLSLAVHETLASLPPPTPLD
ncbi:MAG: ATP-binding protein, partial [Chlorobiaceae bacterium]